MLLCNVICAQARVKLRLSPQLRINRKSRTVILIKTNI